MLFLVATSSIAAADPSRRDDDPFLMLREEKHASATSQRPQPLSESPSIVAVITAQEIHAMGYRTLGEALQWVRGLYTRYDRNYTYLGVRGVQRPGDYNNKVLLTIDGHSMNSPIYGDAAFGRELGLDLEQVERIEVVRGPGSALYGSNAFLAVVNVVTREGRSAPAFQSSAGVGNLGERRAFAGVAGARPGWPEYSISGSWTDAMGGPFDPLTGAPRLDAEPTVAGLDRDRGWSMLGRARWGESRLAMKFNDRKKNVPTGAYGTRLGDGGTFTRDGHDFVELSTLGQPAEFLEVRGRAYWDGYRYSGEYAYGPDSARYLNQDFSASDVIGAEVAMNVSPVPHHAVTVALEGRRTLRAEQWNADLDPYVLYTRSNARTSQAALSFQDETHLFGAARITAGARTDVEAGRAGVLSPRLDILVPLPDRSTWKLMAGSAFRAPVPYETEYAYVGQVPNAGLLPERVTTLESSLEHRFGDTRARMAVYRSWIRDLIEASMPDSLGNWSYYNRGRLASTGIESEVDWSARPGLNLRADIAYQRTRDAETPVHLSNSPFWNAHLVVVQAVEGTPLRLGLAMRWLGARTTLASTRLPSYSVVDGRFGWAPRAPFELGLELRNVLGTEYADPAGAEHSQDAIRQDGRSVYVTLRWQRAATP